MCLRVVRPESEGGQIPECTGPMRWPSGAPGSMWVGRRQAWECRRKAWEHLPVPATSLGVPTTWLGALATSLRAPRITVEQSGKTTSCLGTLLLCLEIIATTYRLTILKLMHSVCILIFVSI